MSLLAFPPPELDTPAFRQFLKEAAASFLATVKRMQTKPEDVMPWKLQGERWHLGEKGFTTRLVKAFKDLGSFGKFDF